MSSIADIVLLAVLGHLFDATKPVKAKTRSVPSCPDLRVLSYVPYVKHGPDDKVFQDSWMRDNVPRGFVVVYDVAADSVVAVARGNRKFGGVTSADDDESEDVLLSVSTLRQWAADGVLEVTSEEKENGKFALVKMFRYGGKMMCLFGSKTSYRVVASADEALALAASEQEADQVLIQQIARDVAANWNALRAFFEDSGDVTLVGELCDGLHFVPKDAGEPVIKFFGIFDNGNAREPAGALALMEHHGIRHVDHHLVSFACDALADNCLRDIIAEARAGNREGKVLYFRNTETGETVLAKNKSAVYIMKRVLRSLLQSRDGFKAAYADLSARFVDRAKYHMLNTEAAVRFYRTLVAFLDWMIANRVPSEALDCMPVTSSVMGDYPYQGFAAVWQRFLEETGVEDMVATPDDIGAFDAEAFRAAVGRAPARPSDDTPPIVLFLQIPPGGGKSTIAAEMEDAEVVEQDQWYGKTRSCQAYLSHLVEQRPDVDVIVVPRCNANPEHYSSYLDRALAGGARVVFAAPEGIETEQGLAICLAGVERRSKHGDTLLLGRKELPASDAVEIVKEIHGAMKVHPKARRFSLLGSNYALRPPSDIAADLAELIEEVRADPAHPNVVHPGPLNAACKLPLYSAFHVCPESDAELRLAARELAGIECLREMHCTEEFFGRLSKKQMAEEAKNPTRFPSPRGAAGTLDVTHLVVKKSNGHAAFRAENTSFAVKSGKPHITAYVPLGAKAVQSGGFVFSDDPDEVTVYGFVEPIEVCATCVWPW